MDLAEGAAARGAMAGPVREGTIERAVQDTCPPHLLSQLGPQEELATHLSVVHEAKAELVSSGDRLQKDRCFRREQCRLPGRENHGECPCVVGREFDGGIGSSTDRDNPVPREHEESK